MKSYLLLEQKLHECASKGLLSPRQENNAYLKLSYKGSGGLISDKWNVKIYTSGSVVCTDLALLDSIVKDTLKAPDSSKKVIQIDDSGWGSPLCGVLVGLTDGTEVWTDEVDVSFFQSPLYETKGYLEEYARKGISILNKKGVTPSTHRIEICTGYVNTCLKDKLRAMGYEVRVAEIKGLLQDQLETVFKNHIKEKTGKDLGYDPKECTDNRELAAKYYAMLNWGRAHAPHLLKSGWKSMKDAA